MPFLFKRLLNNLYKFIYISIHVRTFGSVFFWGGGLKISTFVPDLEYIF